MRALILLLFMIGKEGSSRGPTLFLFGVHAEVAVEIVAAELFSKLFYQEQKASRDGTSFGKHTKRLGRQKSQESGFRKQQFWRPVKLDLLI